MNNYIKVLLFALTVFILSGCKSNVLFEKSDSLSNEGWNNTYHLDYNVVVEDDQTPFNFYINIRNNNDYAYSNLFLFLETHFPDESVTRDTLEFILADKKGKWLGNGHGRIKENDFLIRKGFLFPQKGQYQFSVEHGMRTEVLQGIENVGIRIELESND